MVSQVAVRLSRSCNLKFCAWQQLDNGLKQCVVRARPLRPEDLDNPEQGNIGMLNRQQKLGVHVSKQLTEARRSGGHGEAYGDWGREAPHEVPQLCVLELYGIRLAKHHRVLPTESHHQHRPGSEQAAQSADALLRAEREHGCAKRRVDVHAHRAADRFVGRYPLAVYWYLQQLRGAVQLASPPL